MLGERSRAVHGSNSGTEHGSEQRSRAMFGLALRTFNSRISRRLFTLLFCISVIPVALAAYVGYGEVRTERVTQAKANLRATAKSYGLRTLERLQFAERLLTASVDPFGGEVPAAIAPIFTDVVFHAATVDFAGMAEPPMLAEARSGLAEYVRDTGHARVAVINVDGHTQKVVMAARHNRTGIPVTAVLNPEQIAIEYSHLPYAMNYCLSTASGAEIYCATGGVGRGESYRATAADQMLFAEWQLFLDATFRTEPWDTRISLPRDVAVQALDRFRYAYPILMSIVAAATVLLGIRIVRGSLGPVEKLMAVTRSIADGNLEARVAIETRDEFQSLGEAFNDMASRIGTQMKMFESLADLDHRMLDGLDLESICEAVMQNLRLVNPAGWSAVIVSSEFSDGNALTFASTGPAAISSARSSIDIHWMVHNQTEPHYCPPNDHAVNVLQSQFGSFDIGRCWCHPVLGGTRIKAVVLIGCAIAADISDLQKAQVGDVAQRLAVAMNSVERERDLHRKAYFDELTELPNRQLMNDRLEQEILFAIRDSAAGAVLFMDLDRFKQINDLAGHSAGDELLLHAGGRIKNLLRATDTVARIGGDEFVVLMPRIESATAALEKAEEIIESLSRPFEIGGLHHYLGCSVGISIFPDDGRNAETLLKNADIAMYQAKAESGGISRFFSEEMNIRNTERIVIEGDLRKALQASDQLELYYQPQVAFHSDRIVGVEALIRWKHPCKGMVRPGNFIPLAEEVGLIEDVGWWVLRRAIQEFAGWRSHGIGPESVSVNVSPRQLMSAGFATELIRVLREARIEPSNFEIEVTESVFLDNADTAIGVLQELRNAGLRIAIDDFGTGYSSLAQLAKLPFDTLKIDQSFVRNFAPGNHNDAIIRAVVGMSTELGKSTVAEGVENAEQYEFLRNVGCRLAQGFYFSRPLPADDMTEFTAQSAADDTVRAESLAI